MVFFIKEKNMKTKKYLIAHRGYSGAAPENTKLAFDIAKEFGFDGMEIDIHMTKDKKIIVIHDETIDRTSNGKGAIENMTLSQLQKFDYGRQFKINELPFQKLLTLEEFLKLYIDKFKILNIEVKTDECEYLGIEKEVDKIMKKMKIDYNKILFSSFNFETLERLYELDNNYVLGFLWWKHREYKKIGKKRISKICKFLHPWTKLYDQEHFKKEYDKLKLPYSLWTIRSKNKYLKYLKDKKVMCIISDYKY